MSSLKETSVLIIGGASGFGLQIAKNLLDCGAEVAITSRSQDKLQTVIGQLQSSGYEPEGYVFDAADYDSIPALFEQSGAVDHLISMAGGFMGGGFLEAPFDTIRQAIEEKLFTNLAIARAAHNVINDGGSMVFTAGSGGKPHTASGAIIGNEAIATMVKGLAVEVAPRLRVNAVAPTWTPTPLWDHMAEEERQNTASHFAKIIPLGRTATIEEVAAVYIFLMKNSFVTGQTVPVEGGLDLV